MDRTRKLFIIIVGFVGILVTVILFLSRYQVSNRQNVDATAQVLESLYQSCVVSQNIGDVQLAYDACDQLVDLSPNYRDAQDQLKQARGKLLSDYYVAGVAAFEQELWDEAVDWFDLILALDLSYKDVASLKAQAVANGVFSPLPTATIQNNSNVNQIAPTQEELFVPEGGDLIAYWSFDGTDLGYDDSGNGHYGTVFGDPQVIEGVKENALRFGFGDYISITNHPNFEPGINNYSIAVWVRYEEGSMGRKIIVIDYAPRSFKWVQMGGDPEKNEILFGLKSGSNPAQTTVHYTNIIDGNWHFLVGVRENIHQVRLYVDGVLIQERTNLELGFVQTYSQDPIFIGWDDSYGSNFNNGDMDELRVYNRALSLEEIEALYQLEEVD